MRKYNISHELVIDFDKEDYTIEQVFEELEMIKNSKIEDNYLNYKFHDSTIMERTNKYRLIVLLEIKGVKNETI